MAEPPPVTIPFPPQHIANLTHALRTQTNAILEVKAALAVIAERLDHLVHAERDEANDIREIHRAIIDAGKSATEAHHAAVEIRKDITGPIILHTPEQLEALVEEAKKPTTIVALTVLAERIGKLPLLVKWFLGTSIGGAIVEAVHRIFHFW